MSKETQEKNNTVEFEDLEPLHEWMEGMNEKMKEIDSTVDIAFKRLDELENPQDRNNFHHYVRPLADRLWELEKVVEEIYQRVEMNFLINENGEVVEVEE